MLPEELPAALKEFRAVGKETGNLNEGLDAIAAPWAPGRVPRPAIMSLLRTLLDCLPGICSREDSLLISSI